MPASFPATKAFNPFSLAKMDFLLCSGIAHAHPDDGAAIPLKNLGSGGQLGSNRLFPGIS